MIKEKSIMHETELITNFNKLTQLQQNRFQREIIDFCNLNDCMDDTLSIYDNYKCITKPQFI